MTHKYCKREMILSPHPKIHLSDPKTHSSDDIEYLYSKYRSEFPDIFEEWVKIEKRLREDDQDALRRIQNHGLDFLMKNTDWENLTALSSAWSEMRKMVMQFAASN